MRSEVQEVWQNALDSQRGIRVKCETRDAAITLRSRLNHARAQQRREHLKLYPADNVMHGKSFYEDYSVKLDGSDVVILKLEALKMEIEQL